MTQFFSLGTKFRLARSIITKDHPVYVQFYVTARCNLACEQCNIIYANADSSEVSITGIRKIAENLERIGVSIILLTGGEPFARNDLPEIVEAFTRHGMHVRIQTNGLAKESSLRACVEAGAHDISISLDSIQPDTQDRINGDVNGSWQKAIRTLALVNSIFPAESFASLGCVLSPRNLLHIPDLIRFATAIGWFVSVVPAHTTPNHLPQNFRSFDRTCRFQPKDFPKVKSIIDEIHYMRNEGYLVYDSDEYLDDMYRLVRGEAVKWRDRNEGVCDSPNLYFAIQPNGNMAVCCDYRLPQQVSTMSPNFPDIFFSQDLRDQVHGVASRCNGCLYGSFPEMTITSRFLRPFLRRAVFFNSSSRSLLKKLTSEEMEQIAIQIREANPKLYTDSEQTLPESPTIF